MVYFGTLLVFISAFVRTQASYTCDDLFTGKVSPPPDCSHSHDRAEIDPNCRIDLGVTSSSEVVLTALRKAYHSDVKLCFGCPENDFYGQCNTVIACHPQTVCYNETHRDKEHNTRHLYGCIWESNNVNLNGHHCSQPSHGSTSGTVTCNNAKLCNGNTNHLHHVMNLIGPTSTTTTPEPTTTPTTTPEPTTTPTTTPEPTTTPTTTPEPTTTPTTTPEPTTTPTTTPEPTTTPTTTPEPTTTPTTTTPEPITTPTTTPEPTTTPTTTSEPITTTLPLESTTAKTTFMTEQSTSIEQSTSEASMTSMSTATFTDAVTHTQLIDTTTTPMPTTTTPTPPKPCKQGNGTLMCVDHNAPPHFECETFDRENGICGWTDSGHDRAVDQCSLYCGFCDEYCEKLYQAQTAQQSTPAPTTPQPTTPKAIDRSCMVCGSEDNGIPCAPRQVYFNSSQTCSAGKNYCMTSVFVDDNKATTVYKSCVDESTCLNKWLLFSSDNDYCLSYGSVNIAGKYECHFCCTDNDCNTDVYPSSSLYVG